MIFLLIPEPKLLENVLVFINGVFRELFSLNFYTSDETPKPYEVPVLLLISVLNDLWELLGDKTDYFIAFDDYLMGTGVILEELTMDCLLS